MIEVTFIECNLKMKMNLLSLARCTCFMASPSIRVGVGGKGTDIAKDRCLNKFCTIKHMESWIHSND